MTILLTILLASGLDYGRYSAGYERIEGEAPVNIWYPSIVPDRARPLRRSFPLLLIARQPDLGTALMHVLIFLSIAAITRIRRRSIVSFLVAVAVTASAGGRELSQRLAKVETAISRRKTIEFEYYSIERDEISRQEFDAAVEDAEGWTYAQLEKDHALLFLTSSLGCADPPEVRTVCRTLCTPVRGTPLGNLVVELRDPLGAIRF